MHMLRPQPRVKPVVLWLNMLLSDCMKSCYQGHDVRLAKQC